MSNCILIIAHAPLASALRACVMHVYAECADSVLALDVMPHCEPEDTLQQAQRLVDQVPAEGLLVLTDVFGATPANVAQKLVGGRNARLLSGVNLPMLYRAVCYCHEALEALVARALAGGTQGVMQVNITAQQNQIRRNHDQNSYDHQQ